MEMLAFESVHVSNKICAFLIEGVSSKNGSLRSCLDLFGLEGIDLNMIVQSVPISVGGAVDLFVTCDACPTNDAIAAVCGSPVISDVGGKISFVENVSFVSLKGVGFNRSNEFLYLVYEALAAVEVNILAQACSDVEIGVVIDCVDAEKVGAALVEYLGVKKQK